jgi:hypothetical protein
MMNLKPLALVPLAACFGSGPTPTPPAGATVVYRVPQANSNDVCTTSRYIGPVEIAGPTGYVIPLPYSPETGQCNGPPPQESVNVVQFPKNGKGPDGTMLPGGGAGQFGGGAGRPALATHMGALRFLFASSGALEIGPEIDAIGTATGSLNIGSGPLSLVFDDSHVYFATLQNNGGATLDPFSPTFPCCGGSGGSSSGYVYSVPLPLGTDVRATQLGGAQGTPQALFCDEIDHCIVLAGSNVAFLEHEGSQIVAGVRMFTPDGTSIFPLGDTGSIVPLGAVPVGLDSDGTRIVSSFAMSATGGGSGFPVPPGCWIFQSTAGTMDSTHLVFHTMNFSCMDARIDGNELYFAIIGSDHCQNCGGEYPLHGLGIGRVSLIDNQNFESISLGVSGVGAGPRRVRLDADYIFAIDTTVIARIDKTDLDGKHDFEH